MNLIEKLNSSVSGKSLIKLKPFDMKYSQSDFYQSLDIVWEEIIELSEYGCYVSCFISIMIAFKLLKMAKWNIANLNFINMMLFFYYTLDSFTGTIEIFFLFKLYKERYLALNIKD